MRLGILSDTHDQLQRTHRAIALLREANVDILIHCGDVTSPEIIEICAVRPLYMTFGNHDADNVPTLREALHEANGTCLNWGGEITLAGKRIAVTHGHMSLDLRHLLRARPDYLLTGHSHIARDWREGRTRRINPGALHEADHYTVALLDLTTDELRFLALD